MPRKVRIDPTLSGRMGMKPKDGYGQQLDELLEREWLITNRLGGYA